ncbi:AMP-binding protein [Kribbella qitaiheensis]|uniref:AMP-binding protein n=1 Tax=Kribbella qitaiheensis TaxID=1544730 RepID=UPI001625180A|nr:AMP-binding protein [Kribbella qitaiheensis]
MRAGVVGEVWLSGPNVAAGYWADPERTAEVFGATLADGTGPWLRTGDLGALYDGELYLTGRLKDLIIVDGQNHHPQDIEAIVAAAHSRLRPGRVRQHPADLQRQTRPAGNARLVPAQRLGCRSG